MNLSKDRVCAARESNRVHSECKWEVLPFAPTEEQAVPTPYTGCLHTVDLDHFTLEARSIVVRQAIVGRILYRLGYVPLREHLGQVFVRCFPEEAIFDVLIRRPF
jgi:hypothetical protein